MKTQMQAVLLVVSVMAVGCGGPELTDGHDGSQQVTTSNHVVGALADSVITLTKPLHLEVWNYTSDYRICALTYRYPNWDGSTVSGAIVASEALVAGEKRGGTIYVPYGCAVTVTTACWHPSYPEFDIRASNSITTLPMDRARWCQATYSETYGPQMTIPCWY